MKENSKSRLFLFSNGKYGETNPSQKLATEVF